MLWSHRKPGGGDKTKPSPPHLLGGFPLLAHASVHVLTGALPQLAHTLAQQLDQACGAGRSGTLGMLGTLDLV